MERQQHDAIKRVRKGLPLTLIALVFAGCGGSSGGSSSGSSRTPQEITFAVGQTFTVAEDAGPTHAIGTVQATAADGSTVTFAAEAALFDVSEAGVITIKVGKSLDHETATSHALKVTAAAEDATAVAETVTINVSNVLENTITFAAGQTFTVAEGADSTYVIGTVQATAADGSTVTFAAETALFDVSETGTITLKVGKSLDHETAASHALKVTAAAEDATAVAETVTINVSNVLENSITFATGQAFTGVEGTNSTYVIGVVQASSADGSTVIFAADDTLFDVSETGTITLKAEQTLTAATTHTLAVTATADDAPDITETVTINVVENSITFAAGQAFTVAEDADSTRVIGTVQASSTDRSTVTFAAASDAADILFDVSETGAITLKVGKSLDHETATSYTLAITATAADATAVTETVTINVSNVFENTITFAAGQTFTVAENPAANANLGTVQASASDGSSVIFSTADTLFDVSGAGAITLKAGQTLDYEAAASRSLAVIATAADALDITETVTINVTDIQDGSATEPYAVDSLAELQSIATGFQNEALSTALSAAASLTQYYAQTGDIDASTTASGTWQKSTDPGPDGTSGDTSGDTDDDVTLHGFLPIGNCGADNSCASGKVADNVPFSGGFDGQGYRISGLFIERSITQGVGLFGVIGSAATLQHIALEGGSTSGADRTGSLVGYSAGTISHCYATGDVSSANSSVGGLVGTFFGTVSHSYASGTVSGGEWFIGGLVGSANGSVRASFATGPVINRENHTGGLVGQNTGGTVRDSFATGPVSGVGDNVGGLVGIGYDTVSHSFATGDIQGQTGVGGLVGTLSSGSVSHSYATGDVSGTKNNVGGLVGSATLPVRDGYAIGSVSGPMKRVGGLIGDIDTNSLVARGYCVDGTIKNDDGNDDGTNDCVGNGGGTNTAEVTEAFLRGLACDADTVFRWDNPDDNPDAGALDCATAGATVFPWDFGISTGAASELPVLNGIIGGVLDAAGQRALVAFARVIRTADGTASTLAAPTIAKQDEAHTLAYRWGVVAGSVSITAGAYSDTVSISGAANDDVIAISIIEREAAGGVVRVYGDIITLTVASE